LTLGVTREEAVAMGGPWRERGFDATRWQRPVAQAQAKVEEVGDGVREMGLVIAYVAAVALSLALLVVLGGLSW
jgi:hypothetical protein